jgi:uncharacterized protein YjbJ (UPF0337 family)
MSFADVRRLWFCTLHFNGVDAMNEDWIKGHWKQLKGKIREKWGKLTDDDVDVIAGKGEVLVGKLQERYGIARDEAENQARKFFEASDELSSES